MYTIGKYKGTDKMSDLICTQYAMLSVMSRFGIKLGFGDKTIREVCEDNGVDTATFLAVINVLDESNEAMTDEERSKISVKALVDYLVNSHRYFLGYKLPLIRQKLIEAIDWGSNDISMVIMRYFDEYVNEVNKHMQYEDEVVFPYVTALLDGNAQHDYNIEIFSRKHDNVERKLSELKDIIIKYCPARSTNELNGALFDIFSCADELISHNTLEDKLLIPAIHVMEQNK